MSFEIGEYIEYDFNRSWGHNHGEPLYGRITDITYSIKTTSGEDVKVSLLESEENQIKKLEPPDVKKARELHRKYLQEKRNQIQEEIRQIDYELTNY